MRALIAGLLLAAIFAPRGAMAEPPLRVGVVPYSPPFVLQDASGKLTGFSVALFRAIAGQMKRDIVFVAAPLDALVRDLANNQLDALAGPVLATPDRAAELLFTEGYVWSEYQFGSRAGGPAIKSPADLRGKRLAVLAASDYDEWAERNAGKLGFTVVAQTTPAAVLDAVRNGTAQASLSGSPALRAAVAGHSGIVGGLALPETRTQEAAAVAESNVELRDEIEDSLRCLKQSGAVARLAQNWFGTRPGAEDLENMVLPGYGVPDLAGFDPKPRKTHCGS